MKKKHVEATRDYVAHGMSMEKISKKYRVTHRTVQNWAVKYSWPLERKRFVAQYTTTIYEKMTKRAEEASERFLEVARIVGQIAVEKITEEYKKRPNISLNAVTGWTKVAKLASELMKNALPSIDEELAAAMLRELKEIDRKRIEMGIDDSEPSRVAQSN